MRSLPNEIFKPLNAKLVNSVLLILFASTLAFASCSEKAETFVERGDAYSAGQQWQEAISQYSKAIEKNTQFVDAYYKRGIAYRCQPSLFYLPLQT